VPQAPSLDHLIGEIEHARRNDEAQRLCGFEVGDHLAVILQLLDTPIARVLAIPE
jgi:hypothetical protein